MKVNEKLQKTGAALLLLAVWQAAAMLLDRQVLLASPAAVVIRLGTIWREPDFWRSIGFSFIRIAGGFGLGLLLGTGLAVLAGRFRAVEILLWPLFVTVKSVPVASFIVISLIWLSSAQLSVFISFLMVLPIVYTNVLGGIRGADRKLVQMADVFRVPWTRRLHYIWLPQVRPYLVSACSLSLGLAWKSGIAAEIIGIPSGSVGEMLYNAKAYLNTVDLFAWTVVIVLVSVAFEKLFLALLNWVFGRMEKR